jgi:hypothetical protein
VTRAGNNDPQVAWRYVEPPEFDFTAVSCEGLKRRLSEALNQQSYWEKRWSAIEEEMARRCNVSRSEQPYGSGKI